METFPLSNPPPIRLRPKLYFPSSTSPPQPNPPCPSTPPSPSSPNSFPTSSPGSPSSSSSSSSNSNQTWSNMVYMNCCGEGVIQIFSSRLSNALREKGFTTIFNYNEMLFERGQTTPAQFLQGSACSIVLLSKNYAFSPLCLDDLVMILECHNRIGQRVYTIYYDVDPTEVRKQRGSFHQAFASHEQTCQKPDKIRRWRHALSEIAAFPIWSLGNKDEINFIKHVVTQVAQFLTSRTHSIIDDDHLIGMDERLKKLGEKVCLGSRDVHFIGIYGCGGIGKTALAKRFYNSLSSQFEHKSFLADVGEQTNKYNLPVLQEQLLRQTLKYEPPKLRDVYDGASMIRNELCDKRSLIVIDGVDDDDQLCYLARNYDWFGSGSIIIITSRNKYLLARCGVEKNCIYELPRLNHHEALALVNFKAFGRNKPPTDMMKLCRCIVAHASGLPQVLEVFGSVLNGRASNECMLFMRNVEKMGRRIVKDTSSKPGKGRRFWREELSRLLVPKTQKVDMEWVFIMINFSVELLSAVFDQLSSPQKLHYALLAMIMSFVGLLFSILDIVYKARKEKVIWRSNSGSIPWFYYPCPEDDNLFGSFADMVGLVSALCQPIVVTINYLFVVHQAGSPIKISVWPMVFAFLVVFAKVIEGRNGSYRCVKCKLS